MKNRFILTLVTFGIITTGCSQLKPTININYIQQDLNQSQQPKIQVDENNINISSIPKRVANVSSNKIKMYFVYKDGCPACDFMKKAMRRDDIEAILDKDFEIIRVNIRDKYMLPKAWMRPFRSPTIYFMDKNQEELISSIHGMSARRFKQTLLEAIEARDLE